MKILVIGQCFDYKADGFACCHGVEGRDLGLARGLARLGNSVHILGASKGPTDDGMLERVTWDNLNVFGYDGIVLSEITAWGVLKKHPFIAELVSKHGNVVAALDAVYMSGPLMSSELSFCKAIGQTTPQLVAAQKHMFPRQSSFLLQWGCPDLRHAKLDNPFKGDAVRAVYMGIVLDRYLKALNELAVLGKEMGFEIWVSGLFFSKGNGGLGGLTDEERSSVLNNNVHLLTDIIPAGGMGHGATRYGDAFGAIAHASVALNFTLEKGMATQHCKIFDYLGCGCPVISEEGCPTNGHITTLNAGRVVPWGDVPAMAQAILEESKVARNREIMREEAQSLSSWDASARILESYLLR